MTSRTYFVVWSHSLPFRKELVEGDAFEAIHVITMNMRDEKVVDVLEREHSRGRALDLLEYASERSGWAGMNKVVTSGASIQFICARAGSARTATTLLGKRPGSRLPIDTLSSALTAAIVFPPSTIH